MAEQVKAEQVKSHLSDMKVMLQDLKSSEEKKPKDRINRTSLAHIDNLLSSIHVNSGGVSWE